MIRRISAFFPFQIPALLWTFVIFILLSVPGSSIPHVSVPHADKLVHISMFFIHAFLVWIAISLPRERWFATALGRKLCSAAIAVCYGAFGEYYQRFIPSRSADVMDAVANALGAFLFLLVVTFFGEAKILGGLSSWLKSHK